MSSIKKDSMYLYNGFRPYVPKKKLADYDSDFFNRKRYTIKYMTSLIEKYVNIKYYHKKPKNDNDGVLFNFFLYDFSIRDSKINVAFNDFRDTPSML
ncbi:hypothetical protein I2486_17095 [Cellulophaga sp. E16_2]|uniref:hypothetical protein n=1 Tax=Cellulophaga sp. E16_2 TaxID=2789297 RepID=UPI001A910460|nr:hypothetical protein [Cellulophaga sp. E16_2]MBO0593121.1 hypothetical protein [Cellulophaga sp. E16_2]